MTVRAPSRRVLAELYRIWDDAWTAQLRRNAVPGLAASLLLIPMGQQAGENVMGLKPATEYLLAVHSAVWRDEKDDVVIRAVARTAYARSVSYLKRVGHYGEWTYAPR